MPDGSLCAQRPPLPLADRPALPAAVRRIPSAVHRGDTTVPGLRAVPEETPVAFTYERASYAVMMATPADLADFALGFSLTEGVIEKPADLQSLDIVAHDTGIELRMRLVPDRADRLFERKRRLTGPVGCGLCGIESLAGALPPIPAVGAGIEVGAETVAAALAAMVEAQALNRQARALHAAGLFVPGEGLVALREDVGRHNALDKLIGEVSARGRAGAAGMVVVTSRVSIEMVHKAAVLGAAVVVAVSAPTALGVRAAEAAGITLIAIARDDGFEVFTHPHRLRAG